jgi:mono/diheme cytochrome c family protein
VLGTVAVLIIWPLHPIFPQVPPGPAQNVLAGSRIFGANGCATCHAINGLGGTGGPDLGRAEESRSFYDFAAGMWNHLPKMASQMRELGIEQPHLDSWEMGDLIAFLFWHDYFDPPGDAERGQRLFAEKGCIMCHQVRGQGGVAGPGLDFLSHYGSPIQIAAALWNHGPEMTREMSARGMQRPRFTNAELTDVIAYLSAAKREEMPVGPVYILPGRSREGRHRFVDKGCAGCHGIAGRGSNLAPDLAGVRARRNVIEFAAAMWNKAPRMLDAMERHGLSIPRLEAQDMADLVAYLSSVEYFGELGSARRGRELLRAKGCQQCHSISGRGGGTAPDLATVRILDPPAGAIAALWNHVVIVADSAAGRPLSWATLRPAEMADLTAYFETLTAGNR